MAPRLSLPAKQLRRALQFLEEEQLVKHELVDDLAMGGSQNTKVGCCVCPTAALHVLMSSDLLILFDRKTKFAVNIDILSTQPFFSFGTLSKFSLALKYMLTNTQLSLIRPLFGAATITQSM